MLRRAFYLLIVVFLSIGFSLSEEYKGETDSHGHNTDVKEKMEGMGNMGMESMDMAQMQGMMQIHIGMMQMHMGMMQLGKLPAISPEMKEEMMSLMHHHMSFMKEHMANGMTESHMMGGNMNGKMQMEEDEKDIAIDMDSMMDGCSLDGECSGQEEESDSAEEDNSGAQEE